MLGAAVAALLMGLLPVVRAAPLPAQSSFGQWSGGIEQLHKVSEDLERQLGPLNPLVLRSWAIVASFLEVEGHWAEAEALYKRVLDARLASVGSEHLDTADALTALAGLRLKQGRFDQARELHSRALAIREHQLGANAVSTLQSREALAVVDSHTGRWDSAEQALRQVLQQRRHQLGPDHVETLTALNELGLLMERQSRWLEAERFYREALEGFTAVGDRDDLVPAVIGDNLARTLMVHGLLTEAETLQRRGLASRERLLGSDSPRLATALSNLAETLTLQGRVKEATPLLERGVALLQGSVDADHPDSITLRQNLAMNRWLTHHPQEALELLASAQDAETLLLQREVPLLPLADRPGFLSSVGEGWLAALSLVADHSTLRAAVDLAFRARLNRHGLLQTMERQQALVAAQSGSQRQTIEALRNVQLQLADLSLKADRRAALTEQRFALEQALYRRLPQLKPTLITPEAVAAKLPVDAALVEIQRYDRFDPAKRPGTRWGEAHFIGLILPSAASGQPARVVALGSAQPLETAVQQALRSTLLGAPEAEQSWAQVAERIWGGLRPALKGIRQVYLSLDGDLHRVPLGILQLAEPHRQVQLLTSGRDLLVDLGPADEKRNTPAVVMADPDYRTSAPTPAQSRGGLEQLGPWQRLPATLREGLFVAQVLGTPLIHGVQATAARLIAVHNPQVLHVASHAYFRPEPVRQQKASWPANQWGLNWSDPALDPLLRSGLVLSTPVRPERNDDDGYLTAAEMARMQLTGTQLVTLSACDTGRGVRRVGEAVYGLQRALQVAGARATLLSLWKVDDQATEVLMRRFYRRALQGEPLTQALQEAQQEFRRDPALKQRGWSHPFYWAGWQLVGIDASLLL